MSDAPKRPRSELLPIAEELVGLLRSACVRIEIAGSLRRETREVGDIELVAIPAVETLIGQNPEELFETKIETKVNRLWAALDGFFEPTSGKLARGTYIRKGPKYRSFAWPTAVEGRPVQVDLFTTTPEAWGWIYLLRTGSETFSHHVMTRLNEMGYTSHEGAIHKGERYTDDSGRWKMRAIGGPILTPDEERVFELAKIPIRHPRQRT